jgi:acetyltransferase
MVYSIHRYPAHLIRTPVLRDGRSVTVRPVLPQDAPLMQDFVRGLSPVARYRRFLVGMPELTPMLLDRFTQVNYDEHLALVAVHVDEALAEHIVAEARYVTEGDASCEFAVAVADGWQGQGLGALLVSMLIDTAARAGFAWMRADVLHDNAAMIAVARGLGFTVRTNYEEPRLLRLERVLAPRVRAPRHAAEVVGA